jgi:hypothetical protein
VVYIQLYGISYVPGSWAWSSLDIGQRLAFVCTLWQRLPDVFSTMPDGPYGCRDVSRSSHHLHAHRKSLETIACRCLQMLRVQIHARQRLQHHLHHHCLAFQSGVQTKLNKMVFYRYRAHPSNVRARSPKRVTDSLTPGRLELCEL